MKYSSTEQAHDAPVVFTKPGALLYASNCQDLLAASLANKVTLNAWARNGYPGLSLGNTLPKVCSVGGWDATAPQDWGLKEHCNEGVKIAYIARGTLTLTLDNEKYRLNEGQMFVVRPWQLHAFGDPCVDPSQIIWVLFDMEVRRPHEKWHWPDWIAWPERDLLQLTEFISKNEQPWYYASKEVAASFIEIAKLVEKNQIDADEAMMRLLISKMLLHFKDQLTKQPQVLDNTLIESQRTVEIFLQRIKYQLEDDWTLENMAVECNLSRTQFAKHCMSIKNMTPVRYLQMKRLDAARTMLVEDEQLAVTNIAFDCGFTSSQYFATCFRKRFGYTPNEARSQMDKTPSNLQH